mgnify:FL=1
MFSKNLITTSTGNYSDKIKRLREEIETADAIIIGAGAGLSTSAGLTYSGERFDKHFSDFRDKYGITDMYYGGFYPYQTLEEYWAWWSRHIYINRYDAPVGKPYSDLLELFKDKDFFVITTNVDHQFQLAGFDKKRLFYSQGDYGLWQCSKACHQKTYDNEEIVRLMITEQKDMKVPTELIPLCPVCGEAMAMNLRSDDSFVQDKGWYAAHSRYKNFISNKANKHVLFLELGVGTNTPVIIKYPFWRMTHKNRKASYACINYGEAFCPTEILEQSICIDEDLGKVISEL